MSMLVYPTQGHLLLRLFYDNIDETSGQASPEDRLNMAIDVTIDALMSSGSPLTFNCKPGTCLDLNICTNYHEV